MCGPRQSGKVFDRNGDERNVFAHTMQVSMVRFQLLSFAEVLLCYICVTCLLVHILCVMYVLCTCYVCVVYVLVICVDHVQGELCVMW